MLGSIHRWRPSLVQNAPLSFTRLGAKGEFEWCPTLAVAMPDEVFWPGQSHRDHVIRVAKQGQARAEKKAESSKKIPRLSDR
jgi:hypothetical protein